MKNNPSFQAKLLAVVLKESRNNKPLKKCNYNRVPVYLLYHMLYLQVWNAYRSVGHMGYQHRQGSLQGHLLKLGFR